MFVSIRPWSTATVEELLEKGSQGFWTSNHLFKVVRWSIKLIAAMIKNVYIPGRSYSFSRILSIVETKKVVKFLDGGIIWDYLSYDFKIAEINYY